MDVSNHMRRLHFLLVLGCTVAGASDGTQFGWAICLSFSLRLSPLQSRMQALRAHVFGFYFTGIYVGQRVSLEVLSTCLLQEPEIKASEERHPLGSE